MIEPLTQTVEIPLWLLLVFLAYSETRIGKATGGLKRLGVSRQSEASDEQAAEKATD